MTFKHRILSLSGAGILAALLLGGICWVGETWLIHSFEGQSKASRAVRQGMQIDMMHDALRADVLAALMAKANPDAKQRAADLATVRTDLADHMQILDQALETLTAVHVSESLDATIAAVTPALKLYATTAGAVVNADGKPTLTTLASFNEQFKQLEQSLAGLGDQIEQFIRDETAKGQVVVEQVRFALAVTLVLTTVLLLILSLYLFRKIMAQLGADPTEAVAAARRIADGDFEFAMADAANGSVMEALKTMQSELRRRAENERASIAAERVIANENLRIKAALDNVTSNVMIANNERQIVYMNGTVSKMMLEAEADLRKALPQFDARKLQGGLIDMFHKNPAHQAQMLAALKTSYSTEIKIGSLTFGLIASPIINDKGERLGTVVEWRNRTVEVAVEQEVATIVGAAANGDFSQRVALDGKEGFFKGLAESINSLLATSSVGLNEVGRVLGALASGDLTQHVQGDFKGTFGKLQQDTNTTIDQLTQIIPQIKTATETINTAAQEISAGNDDLSSRTEQQAASLEETASSMEELTSTVRQNAENAKTANQLAIGASSVAAQGGKVVSEVVTTMTAINDSSKKVVDIITVIDGIAFQTNILALNAAVEAARAGEQGRGFAVVASEVRSLAQRSASAAKEIKSLIGDSVEKVGNGSKLVEQAGKTMDEIVSSVQRVTSIMSEITAASQEQSQGIEQVNQTVAQMDEVTQQNAALVEEATAAAKSLEGQAAGLTESVSQFKLDVAVSPAAITTELRTAPPRSLAPIRGLRPATNAGRSSLKPRAKTLAAVPKRGGLDDKPGEQWSEF